MLNFHASLAAIHRAATHALKKFAHDNGGNIAILFAATIIPAIIAIGAAIDYSRASQVKTAMQTALNSTALHLGLLPDDSTQAVLKSEAANYFAANYQGDTGVSLGPIKVLKDGPAITLKLDANLPTMFMGIANIDNLDVGALSEVLLGGGTIEIALVLDNSGSMAGSKLSALKTAARGLVATLHDALPPNSTDLSFSLVPFATFVDVGESNANASWMDHNALSPIHSQNFNRPSNRFTFFNNMTNVKWEGCVEARPYPHDVLNSEPTSDTPETLFVPAFAPDEPDPDWRNSGTYYNSYLNDSNNGNETIRQEHTNKYRSGATATPATWGTTYNFGPSLLCKQSDLTPLTTSQSIIDNKLQAMFAKGGTNIVQELVWGWRTLSPGEPFITGRAYSDNRNQKILILLTDGQNSYNGANNINHSMYMAYGYSKHGRLGTTSNSATVLNNALNTRTAEACENIKDTDILVYTITFDVNDPGTLALMKNCAKSPAYYYDSPSVSDLDDVFDEIAAKLLKLRLTK